MSKFGEQGDQPGQFYKPWGLAIDRDHDRILVADRGTDRIKLWSLSEQLFLSCVGQNGSGDLEFNGPQGIAIDKQHHRIIIADTQNNRLVFLSSIDLSFLFSIGKPGSRPSEFYMPSGIAIDDDRHRIIVADRDNNRLQSFTHEGHHISSFDCGSERPFAVAFDEHRGLIAFSAGHRVHVIGANQWLADTFTWLPDRHRYAPSWMKQAVSTMTMI